MSKRWDRLAHWIAKEPDSKVRDRLEAYTLFLVGLKGLRFRAFGPIRFCNAIRSRRILIRNIDEDLKATKAAHSPRELHGI